MMMQEIVTLISTVGFPIFACVFLAKYINTREQEHIDELRRYNDALIRMEESAQRTEDAIRQTVEAINRNTASMERLAACMAKGGDDDDD